MWIKLLNRGEKVREILFRGKRRDNKQWVEGYLIHDEFCNTNVPYIGYLTINGCNVADVIPETVGQYTGLTDKNGEKIFEGDILKGMGDLHRVYFDTTLACFEWAKINDNWDKSFFVFANECEVIGNIHDNPELLGGDSNG